jgi:glycosyltransferase involved in cell wall biosynthesis
MKPIAVMNLVDSLAVGGTERTAINIVNYLPAEKFRPILCTTRKEGPQADLVASRVTRLRLQRNGPMSNISALRELVRFIEKNEVRILHAHSSCVFLARLAKRLTRGTVLIWHVHRGGAAHEKWGVLPYGMVASGVDAAVTANGDLQAWVRDRYRIRRDRVWYIPNLASAPPEAGVQSLELPGRTGSRIVCVANIRPEKDHPTLIRAMGIVRDRHPEAHLILVGVPLIPRAVHQLEHEIETGNLQQNVTYLGHRPDAQLIMRACDIGVLSSVSEGLPVSLLEYGMARLPVVATAVGQNADVVAQGDAGLLVPQRSPEALAEALNKLLDAPALREKMRESFHARVDAIYGPKAVIGQISEMYETVLNN